MVDEVVSEFSSYGTVRHAISGKCRTAALGGGMQPIWADRGASRQWPESAGCKQLTAAGTQPCRIPRCGQRPGKLWPGC